MQHIFKVSIIIHYYHMGHRWPVAMWWTYGERSFIHSLQLVESYATFIQPYFKLMQYFYHWQAVFASFSIVLRIVW